MLPYLSIQKLGVHLRTSTPPSSPRTTTSFSNEYGLIPIGRLSNKAPLAKPVALGSTDTLKIILTAKEDGTAKRPHQAFLLLTDQDTGLEATLPFSVKDTGKGKVDFVGSPVLISFSYPV
jgi:hypothetical protein